MRKATAKKLLSEIACRFDVAEVIVMQLNMADLAINQQFHTTFHPIVSGKGNIPLVQLLQLHGDR